MGSESKNIESQRREKDGVTYFDRGRLAGKDGVSYDRYAIQTHFIEVGEDQAELVKRILDSPLAVQSINARVFWDSKRPIKCEALNRLNLLELAKRLGLETQYRECVKPSGTKN